MKPLFEIDDVSFRRERRQAGALLARALRLALEAPPRPSEADMGPAVRSLVACAGYRSAPLAMALHLVGRSGPPGLMPATVVDLATYLLQQAQRACACERHHAA